MFLEIYSYYIFVFILVFLPFYQVKDIFPIYDFYKKSFIFDGIINKKISKSESPEKNDSKSTSSFVDSTHSSNVENNNDSSVSKKVFKVAITVICVATFIFGCYYIYKNFPSDFFDPKKGPSPSPSIVNLSSIPPLEPFPSLEVSSSGLNREQQNYLMYLLDEIEFLNSEQKKKIFFTAIEKPHRYAEFLRALENTYYKQ